MAFPKITVIWSHRIDITGATPVWDPYFIETLDGPFSAVSTHLIARVVAFFCIFRDLQDFHSFAPLKWQKFKHFLLNLLNLFLNKYWPRVWRLPAMGVSRRNPPVVSVLEKFRQKFIKCSPKNRKILTKKRFANRFWWFFLISLNFKDDLSKFIEIANFEWLGVGG